MIERRIQGIFHAGVRVRPILEGWWWGVGGKVVSDQRFMKMKTSRQEQLVLRHPADGFVDSDTPGQFYPGSAITGR